MCVERIRPHNEELMSKQTPLIAFAGDTSCDERHTPKTHGTIDGSHGIQPFFQGVQLFLVGLAAAYERGVGSIGVIASGAK
jgi:hypothetical protein